MPDQLPAPLVPAEVDLRGLEYMPLLGDRLFGSDFYLDANDAEFRVGLTLWWSAWKQVPAGSLPDNDSRLCKLAGLDGNRAKWSKVRERALHGFVKCSDGRLYHPVVAQQAMIAWAKRAEDREERENEAERQRRHRDERKKLFAELRAAGVVPAYNTKTEELRALASKHVTSPVTVTSVTGDGDVTVTVTRTVTSPVTRTATAKTGRDGTGIPIPPGAVLPPPLRAPACDAEGPTGQDARPEPPPSPPEPGCGEEAQSPTRAGLACRAMRQAGLQGVNPSDPRLQALLGRGVTAAELGDLAVEAVAKGKGWAWVLGAAKGRRDDAAGMAQAAGPGPSPRPPAPSGAKANDDFERYRREDAERRARTPEQAAASVAARERALAMARDALKPAHGGLQ